MEHGFHLGENLTVHTTRIAITVDRMNEKSATDPASNGVSDKQVRGQPEHDYLQQLRWRSRRGLLELELLLLPFAGERLTEISTELLGDYERLLECEDLDIYDWLQSRSQPEDGSLEGIVSEVSAFQASRGVRRQGDG
jgi:antitoxin CptB